MSDHLCPSCGTLGMSIFYEVRGVPVHSSLLMSREQEALRFPLGDLSLGFCKACGFISNVYFDPKVLDYSQLYEDQQCFSPTFNSFSQNLAHRLIEKYNLYDKDVLEIGCGKGDFLLLLCELGNNRGIGIDPAYIKGRIGSDVSHRLKFIKDYYSERYVNYHGDLVCCRHTLEHIHNTAEFVKRVRRAIGNRLDTIVFFEVPNVTRILHELAFWDIYYEHCSYFSPGSLARLFRSCNFEIVDLYRDFGDQYLLIEAKPMSDASEKVHQLEENVEDIAKDVKYFSAHHRDKLDYWKNRLKQIDEDERKAVVWGSGSKCVSFMTTLGLKDEIKYVIDINPYRRSRFLPGVGKEIMPPEFLKEYKPDITIVMNPIYQDEIRQMLDDMGVSTEVISLE